MYKNTKPLPTSFKIKVNPEQSKVLQEHLFNIGIYWNDGKNEVSHTTQRKILVESYITYSGAGEVFAVRNLQRIRFKDYFAKEIFTLPEKWCIEVTQDNCNELNVWLHRNWKDYEDYKDTWEVTFDNESDLFFSSSKSGWNKGTKDVFYELITTEQFRKQFGFLTETKLQGTKAGNNEFKAEPEGILKNPKTNESKLDTEIRTLIMKIQQSMSGILPLEIERLKKENKSLKITFEAIKEIIQDNPIIKK